jgi:hypothetical protein
MHAFPTHRFSPKNAALRTLLWEGVTFMDSCTNDNCRRICSDAEQFRDANIEMPNLHCKGLNWSAFTFPRQAYRGWSIAIVAARYIAIHPDVCSTSTASGA